MQDFRKLEIYRKSIDYCAEIYKFSAELPDTERYGLLTQIRRAACSVSLNISEGAGTSSGKEFAQFIGYSYRSVNEVLACLELIEKLKLIKNLKALNQLKEEAVVLSRMIYSFSAKLKNSNK